MNMKTAEELKKIVFEALGEASMCWSETPKGVFESTRAEEIGNRVMEAIKEYTSHPTLPSDEEIALKAGQRLSRLTVHDPVQRELTEMEKTVSASGYIAGAKWMRSLCEAKIAEMEREMKDFRELARLISALNEEHENFKSIAGHIKLARKLLTTTTP